MARTRCGRGAFVVALALAVAAVLALRAAATDPEPEPVARPTADAAATEPPPTALHPLLRDWLATRRPTESARLIVTFQPGTAPSDADLAARNDARVLERFWISNSALVELPIGAIAALAARPDVAYVQPEEGGERPPG